MVSSTTEQPRESLADSGALATLFSSPARAKIIEAFVENASRELNVSDIARLSDTSRSTVYDHLESLEELQIIKEVDAGTTRYTLDTEDEVADALNKLQGLTLRRQLELDDDVDL